MKTGLSILVVACCLSVSVMGQMKIENGEGNIFSRQLWRKHDR